MNDCTTAGTFARMATDISGYKLHGAVDGDIAFECSSPASSSLSPPSILSADATASNRLEAVVSFARGYSISTLELLCSGFGGPYRTSKPVSDANASSATLPMSVSPSYGGPYAVSCVAVATTSFGAASPASAAKNVTIPEGPAAASQSAAIRFAVLLLAGEEYVYCDYDAEASVCLLTRALSEPGGSSLGPSRPVDFAFSAISPFPAVDPDNRSPPSDLSAYASDWKWADNYTSLGLAHLIGPASSVLRRPESCEGSGCVAYGAQRLVNYVYSGCDPGPLGALRPWPHDTCPSADPFAFMAFASNFTHDFRHYRALYERYFYESVSGLLSAQPTEE
eukprot:tig00001490_g8972.t1